MSSSKRRASRALFIALIAGAASLAGAATAASSQASCVPLATQPAAGEPTYFKGAIELPAMSLEFHVALVRGLDGEPSGTIDIPVQSVKGAALSEVVWTDDRIAFIMPLPGQPEGAWPNFEFAVVADAAEHRGTLRQAGMEFPATLERTEGAPAGPNRPQLPVAPFPYSTRDVDFENESGGLTIAGTLVVPEGEGPFPCAVFITGSGAQDRDETLFEHRPFLVVADHLARHGIASLRCDDRGVGGTGLGSSRDPDSMDLATDVAAMVEFVLAQPEVDPARVGLIGHSEGGLIGPIVAADDPRVAFLVMLAGPGVPGDEILIRQGEALAAAGGTSAEDLDAQRPYRVALFEAVKVGDTEAARAALAELLRLSSPTMAEAEAGELMEQAVEGQLRMLGSKWMRTFMTMDPREALRRVDCPVLVLNGDLDLQVLHDQNVPEVERALREGGNDRVTVHVRPGLNHLFQPATTGGVMEYASIETTFDPETLEIIRQWIESIVGG